MSTTPNNQSVVEHLLAAGAGADAERSVVEHLLAAGADANAERDEALRQCAAVEKDPNEYDPLSAAKRISSVIHDKSVSMDENDFMEIFNDVENLLAPATVLKDLPILFKTVPDMGPVALNGFRKFLTEKITNNNLSCSELMFKICAHIGWNDAVAESLKTVKFFKNSEYGYLPYGDVINRDEAMVTRMAEAAADSGNIAGLKMILSAASEMTCKDTEIKKYFVFDGDSPYKYKNKPLLKSKRGQYLLTTMLLDGIKTGSEAMVRTTIEFGADVNARDHEPLLQARASGRQAILDILRTAGATGGSRQSLINTLASDPTPRFRDTCRERTARDAAAPIARDTVAPSGSTPKR